MGQFDRRQSDRSDTKQKVDCRNSEGALPEAWLMDLSVSGCQIVFRLGHLGVGQYVVVRLNGLEGLSAVVRWVSQERAGIEFLQELHPSVLAHLLKSPPNFAGNITVSSLGMLDHFGRLLPNLPPIKLFRSVA